MTTSTFRIILDDTSVCAGDEFTAHVYIDSPQEAINATQGTLTYVSEHLTPVSVQYGDSVLRYWVTAPSLPEQPGSIPFTGGLPFPGFQGTSGKIMSVVFQAHPNDVRTTLGVERDAQALLNDGVATATVVTYQDAEVSIVPSDATICQTGPSKKVAIEDNIPPLPFEVLIQRDSKIYEGAYFAVFDTVDEETGIDHYEIQEASQYITTPWINTASPYRLQTQGGSAQVAVRAIDGAGNVRTASTSVVLEPLTQTMSIGTVSLLGLAVAGACVLWFLCRKKK